MTPSSVAICIAVYRPETRFLQELIQSVVRQQTAPAEIVISEDPSDAPPLVLRDVEAPGVSVSVHRNAHRLGMVGNWNQAIAHSRSELAILTGQDDLLLPPALGVHAQLLGRHRDAPISTSTPAYVDRNGLPIHSDQRSVTSERIFSAGKTYQISYTDHVQLALHYGNVTGEPCGSAFRKSAWAAVGGYSSLYPHSADLDFALRLGRRFGSLIYSSMPLSQRRLHGSNLTTTHILRGTTAADRARLFDDFAPDLGSRSARDRARARLLTHELFGLLRTRGRRTPSRRHIRGIPIHGIWADISENLGRPPYARDQADAWEILE